MCDQTQVMLDWFKYRLIGLGWEDPEIYFSIGFCQGDHVAFSATGDPATLIDRLVPRRPANERLKSAFEEDEILSSPFVSRTRNASQVDGLEMNDGVASAYTECLVDGLLNGLREEVRDTERTLLSEGHKIAEAQWCDMSQRGDPYTWSFETASYRFEFELRQPEPDDSVATACQPPEPVVWARAATEDRAVHGVPSLTVYERESGNDGTPVYGQYDTYEDDSVALVHHDPDDDAEIRSIRKSLVHKAIRDLRKEVSQRRMVPAAAA